MGTLPWRWLTPLGAALGWLAGSVLRIRRSHVEAAMIRAGLFATSPSAMYRSLGIGLLELLWLSAKPPEALDEHLTLAEDARAALLDATRAQHGVVIATAHTGNWDLTACAAARWLALHTGAGPLHVVTKRLSVGSLDRFWQNLRRARGVVLLEARGAVARVHQALALGSVAALLVDQVPERPRGHVTLPFLGHPAKTDLAPVLLAARQRVPLLLMVGRRDEAGHHWLHLLARVEPVELRGRQGTRDAIGRINRALEQFVREYPDQWLWLHRRWK